MTSPSIDPADEIPEGVTDPAELDRSPDDFDEDERIDDVDGPLGEDEIPEGGGDGVPR